VLIQLGVVAQTLHIEFGVRLENGLLGLQHHLLNFAHILFTLNKLVFQHVHCVNLRFEVYLGGLDLLAHGVELLGVVNVDSLRSLLDHGDFPVEHHDFLDSLLQLFDEQVLGFGSLFGRFSYVLDNSCLLPGLIVQLQKVVH